MMQGVHRKAAQCREHFLSKRGIESCALIAASALVGSACNMRVGAADASFLGLAAKN